MTSWNKKGDANVGQIWKVSPKTGERTAFGPSIKLGMGVLTGIAFDSNRRLFVGKGAFGGPNPSGVFRVDSRAATRVATMPADTFPNGLAFRGNYLYAADSAIGGIWRLRPDAPAKLSTPWFRHALLAPGNPKKNKQDHGLGADGIAVLNGDLYVGSYDRAAIVRIAIEPSGKAGKATVVSQRKSLKTVDGLAPDAAGNLWLTTNGPGTGRVAMLKPSGAFSLAADRTAWLDYPTQLVVGATPETDGFLYLANGSFDKGKPNILAFGESLP